MLRSILAVLAGIAALTISSFAIEWAADALFMAVFPGAFPNRAALSGSLPASLIMYVYSAACVAAGGYVTAWIAKRRPVTHAVSMGVIQLGLNIWAFASIPHQAALRNWIAGMVFTVPAAWVGGWIRLQRIVRAEVGMPGATRAAGLS
ncbi:MAG TPA: hypothetical protein VLW25_08825 [Bryobacteraceae bacterium]|nr:hypothetical protein [Bryobacteraceae bacterium]